MLVAAAVAVMLFPSGYQPVIPEPVVLANRGCAFRECDDGWVSASVVFGGSSGSGSSGGSVGVPVGCDPAAGVDDGPCHQQVCQVLIDDDAVTGEGVMWTANAADRPFVATGSGQNFGALGTRPGYFSETGTWDVCGTIDTDVVDPAAMTDSSALTAFDAPLTAGSQFYRPNDGLIDSWALRENARAQARPPQPARTGRTPLDGGQTTVKFPTWFWVEPDYWRPYTGADTSDGGRLTVTVSATPTSTTWDTGEGTLTCDQGTQWTATSNLDPWTGSNCMIEYQHSTTTVAAGQHNVTGTVTFETTWRLDFDSQSEFDMGQLPDQSASTTYPLKVGEIHALIINPNRAATGCFHCDGTHEVADF